MGNTLKSANSIKSKDFRRSLPQFRDYATAGPPPSIPSGSNTQPMQKPDLDKYGFPYSGKEFIHYKSHTFCFNHKKRIVNWVMELIDPTNFQGKELKRDKEEFADHWRIRRDFIDNKADQRDFEYLNKGFWACSLLHRRDTEELRSTRLYTNMVPSMHSGYAWHNLEEFCEELFLRHMMTRLWICSGPIFEPTGKFLQVLITKTNNVYIPTHLFKVFVAERKSKFYLASFKVPNHGHTMDEIWSYEVYLGQIEMLAGLIIFPGLDRDNVFNLQTFIKYNLDTIYQFPKPDQKKLTYKIIDPDEEESISASMAGRKHIPSSVVSETSQEIEPPSDTASTSGVVSTKPQKNIPKEMASKSVSTRPKKIPGTSSDVTSIESEEASRKSPPKKVLGPRRADMVPAPGQSAEASRVIAPPKTPKKVPEPRWSDMVPSPEN